MPTSPAPDESPERYRPLLPEPSRALLRQREIDAFRAQPKPDSRRRRRQDLARDFWYGFMIVVGIGGVVLAIIWSAVQH
jgi:hypothetical protein